MGICGKMKLASGLLSLSMAGAGLAEVMAVQKARSRTRRSSLIRSWMLGMMVWYSQLGLLLGRRTHTDRYVCLY